MCEQQPLIAVAHHSNQRGVNHRNLRIYVLAKLMSLETLVSAMIFQGYITATEHI